MELTWHFSHRGSGWQNGDAITSRSEFEPGGAIEVKTVEQVFRRTAAILNLHVAGQVIRTTGEHPFYAYNKGWLKAAALIPGDRLLCQDGQWVAVEDVLDTGEWEVVYNLRIADYHTYFVTDWDWGFSVWSHNLSGCQIEETIRDLRLTATLASGFDASTVASCH